MKNLANYTYLFFVLLFCMSCETTVELNLPDQDAKIVVNATISTDSLFTVHVSKSVGSLENRPKTILYHALVKLYENDVYKEDLKLNTQGFFTSVTGFKPKEGNTYKVEVSLKNYETVTAVCKVPDVTIPTLITYSDSAFSEANGFDNSSKEWYSQIDVTISDVAETTNYYAIQLLQEYPVYDTLFNVVGYQTYPLYVRTNDPNAEISGVDCLISDEYFNGSSYKITVNTPSSSFITDSISRYYLYFKSISRETYLYKKTLNKYYNSNGNPFAEPVRVYSNVENGMGIFGAYSYSLKKIK